MARSNEPIWWVPFMAGAGVAALLMPVCIVLSSIGVAGGWITEPELSHLLGLFLTRLVLFVLICLALFHGAHRLRFVLVDLGLKPAKAIIAVVCYGGAIVGTVLAAALALHWM